MSTRPTPKPLPPISHEKSGEKPTEVFSSRESQELVIAFSGPLGSGIESVLSSTEDALGQAGYEVHRIKLSEYIEKGLASGRVHATERPGLTPAALRYSRLQDGGNALRTHLCDDILAEYAVTRIAVTRTRDVVGKAQRGSIDELIPKKRAFLVDQLKHPAEVQLLRTV